MGSRLNGSGPAFGENMGSGNLRVDGLCLFGRRGRRRRGDRHRRGRLWPGPFLPQPHDLALGQVQRMASMQVGLFKGSAHPDAAIRVWHRSPPVSP